jgi:hypothetical protein
MSQNSKNNEQKYNGIRQTHAFQFGLDHQTFYHFRKASYTEKDGVTKLLIICVINSAKN